MAEYMPSRLFLLNVDSAFKLAGEDFPFSFPPREDSRLTFNDIDVSGVSVEGTFKAVKETVYMNGQVFGSAATICARCLNYVGFEVAAEFSESYVRSLTDETQSDEVSTLEGNFADITESAYSALIMRLPIRSLCKPDCKGLCAVCGIDRNEFDCECDKT